MSEKRYNPNKLRYIKEYQKNKMVSFCLRINKSTETDILEQLSKQENKQGYIKELIRKDAHRA